VLLWALKSHYHAQRSHHTPLQFDTLLVGDQYSLTYTCQDKICFVCSAELIFLYLITLIIGGCIQTFPEGVDNEI